MHLLHLFLSVLTIGLWLPIWLLLFPSRRWCICSQCGRRVYPIALSNASGDRAASPLWFLSGEPPSHSNFNAYLIARNLVYYVPTRAAYEKR
jgi:hypothetical protein